MRALRERYSSRLRFLARHLRHPAVAVKTLQSKPVNLAKLIERIVQIRLSFAKHARLALDFARCPE